MASIHKDPRGKSPFWYGAFYGADGRRKFKSTKATNRTKALEIVVAWENAAQKARAGDLTAAQVHKVMAEMVSTSSGETMKNYSVESWFEEWITNKAASASAATMLRYKQVTRDFLLHLGGRSKKSLKGINSGDIVRFRDHLRAGGRAVSTVNLNIKKVLSTPFEAAKKGGILAVNPVFGVDVLKEEGQRKKLRSIKEPFAAGEVSALVNHAKGEWKGAIVLGATTGLRLGDVVSLKWDNIDQKSGFILVETIKTGEALTLPIHADFATWLREQTQGIGKAPVFPTLIARKINGRAGLSRQFRGIMEKAGIKEKAIEATGDAGRTRFSKGFHSLRHSFASVLANKNVSAEVRQRLTGHKDEATHQGYTDIELKTRKAAVKKIPSVL
jgi:integrase